MFNEDSCFPNHDNNRMYECVIIVRRNGKIVWKHCPHLPEFGYYLEILEVTGVTLHQRFSKYQAQVDFDVVRTIIDCFIC